MSGSYLAAKQRLLTQLELDEGFWFTLVAGPDDRPRDRLRRVVRAWCAEHEVPFIDHALAPEELADVARALSLRPTPGVHWVRAGEGRFSVEALDRGFGQLLLAMNERRDAYVRNLRGAVIVEGRASLLRLLQELAPDLFSIAVPLPETGRDPIEGVDEAARDDLVWWHVLPERADEPAAWVERAHRSDAISERFVALTHAAEALMSRREFSHAAPVLTDALALAEACAITDAWTPSLASLRRRCRVWRAALAIEERDVDAALAMIEGASSSDSSDVRLPLAVERGNALWARGERASALDVWTGVVGELRSAIASDQPERVAACAEGAVCVLERGHHIGRAAETFGVWRDAMRVASVRDAISRDEPLQLRMWIAAARTLFHMSVVDRGAINEAVGSLLSIASAVESSGPAAPEWSAFAALAAAEEQAHSGGRSNALAQLSDVLATLERTTAEKQGVAALTWAIVAARAAELAVAVATTSDGEALIHHIIERLRTLRDHPETVRVLRAIREHVTLARSRVLERAGMVDEALRVLDDAFAAPALVGDPLSRVAASIARGRLLQRTGAREEAAKVLRSVIAFAEGVTRGRELSAQWKHFFVYAWRDLGDVYAADKDHEAARRAYQSALTYARRYSRRHLDDVEAVHEVSIALHPLGMCLFHLGEFREAQRLLNEDLALSRRLVALDPDDPMKARDLALCLLSLSRVFDTMGDEIAAREASEEGRDLLRRLALLDPDDAVVETLRKLDPQAPPAGTSGQRGQAPRTRRGHR